MRRTAAGRTRTVLVIGVLIGVLGLGACTSDREAAVPSAPAGAEPGGTVRVAIDRPGSVDPSNTYEPNGELIVRTMCDPLIQVDPRTGDLVPGLAESWQVSERGSKFVVRLRKGVRFSNGARVTADDVVFTLSRIARDDFASAAADTLALVRGFDVVHGAEESDNTERRNKLEGLQVIDSRSFEMRLRPGVSMADYVRVLAHPLTSPVPRKAAESNPDAFAAAPICSGPYRLAEPWRAEQTTIRLVRSRHTSPANEGYTRGGLGYADEIVFSVVGGLAAQRAAFEGEQVDVAAVGSDVLSTLRSTAPERVAVGPAPAIDYVGVTTNPQTPWGHTAVRVALSQAIDRERIAREVHGGGRLAATGFFPPSLGGKLFRENACAATVPAAGDAEAARRTLSRAGVAIDGLDLPFAFNDEHGNRAVVEAIAAQWREVFGVNVVLQPMTWDAYQQVASSAGGFQGAFRMSWQPSYPGPDQYVGPLFTSGATGVGNLSHFTDLAFDRRLAREVRRANEPDDLHVEYGRVEDDLCEAVPLIPVSFGTGRYLVATDRLATAAPSGRYLELATGFVNLRDLYLKSGVES